MTHRYGEHVALRDVSLQVAPGTLYGLLGPNGSGKTTLFRILSTLMPPSDGEARVFGREASTESDAVRQMLGVVFQDFQLLPDRDVLENVAFARVVEELRPERDPSLRSPGGTRDVSAGHDNS